MIECKYIDVNIRIEKIGNIKLINTLVKDGYEYLNNVEELLAYYLEQIPIRVEKTRNAEKYPDLAFVGKHLIDLKSIIQ